MTIHLRSASSLSTCILILACYCMAPLFSTTAAANGIDVQTLGITADGKTDITSAIQTALDSGKTDLYFPPGDYLLGPLKVPAESHLVFSKKARIQISPASFLYTEVVTNPDGKKYKATRRKPFFNVTGNRVSIEGLSYDLNTGSTDKNHFPVWVIVYAKGISDLTLRDIHITNTSPQERKRGERTRLQLAHVENSRNILLADSSAMRISDMIRTDYCANVTVRGNRMIGGSSMTVFANGSENLRHHDNWSRKVGYQCVWRGGSPDPSRKHPRVPHGTANLVYRDVPDAPPPANRPAHTNGVFDVLIQNNYAEYGTVLCWGNKGRQTIIDGNIARFMWDYSYGSEGGENLIFSNNISINSSVAGFMVMYWSEKVLITGNLVIVRHEPFDPALTKQKESAYFGQFVRLHHGPHNPEDKYGAGSVAITGNLFINELADRPSGISIEAGRDVLVSGNKIINGLVRKHDEINLVKESDANRDMDEFAAQRVFPKENGVAYRMLRYAGADASRVTVTGNEFILRQPGDKPAILIDGTVSRAFIKDNIIRKETTYLTFTDAQRENEKSPPRFMLYSENKAEDRELTCSTPATAIGIAPESTGMTLVQGNIIEGWVKSITAEAPKNTLSDTSHLSLLVTGNTTDGAITLPPPPPPPVQP
ncbi:right-handed parallel beta-helix repeat-containing protein [Opitutaceae bacterium TAV4]|nr:right-handed parallel beta-helix repeat-containing protein [Opitutaceae bacterium TAV4]